MVAEGVARLKAAKGLIRAKVVINEEKGVIVGACVTGDFFAYPEEVIHKLEEELKGAPVYEVRGRIEKVLSEAKLIGSTVDDFTRVIEEAVRAAGWRA